MENLAIQNVEFLDDYKISILLNNCHMIIYDLRPKLKTARFAPLTDERLFRQGSLVRGKVIRWKPFLEVTLDEILFSVTDREKRNQVINENHS